MTTKLLQTYNPLPIKFDHGEGVWLFDENNNRYLDAFCGIAVTGLGHNYPVITHAIINQASKLLHISNLVQIPQQIELAEKLVEYSKIGQDTKVFFNNSGSEAIETLLKLARLYGHSKNIANPKIIVANNSFHGRTLAALSASGNKKNHAGFEPLVSGFVRVNYNDTTALNKLSQDQDIVAVLLEPIQGEGGIRVPEENYLSQVRKICDSNQWLLCLDEVQTGMGRTGKLFAFQHTDIIPDVITLAKGLANGIPIGACLIKEPYASLFKPGSHGSTFGGNPLSCLIGKITLEEIQNKKLWENAAKQGKRLINGLKDKLKKNPHVLDIRGKGLLIGIELDKPCRDILHLAINKKTNNKIIFNITRDTIIRLSPPLIIQSEQIDQIIEIIPKLILDFLD